MSGLPTKMRKWNQIIQFRCTSTKAISIERTYVDYILRILAKLQERQKDQQS